MSGDDFPIAKVRLAEGDVPTTDADLSDRNMERPHDSTSPAPDKWMMVGDSRALHYLRTVPVGPSSAFWTSDLGHLCFSRESNNGRKKFSLVTELRCGDAGDP